MTKIYCHSAENFKIIMHYDQLCYIAEILEGPFGNICHGAEYL